MDGYDSYSNYMANVAKQSNNTYPQSRISNVPFDIGNQSDLWNKILVDANGDVNTAIVNFQNKISDMMDKYKKTYKPYDKSAPNYASISQTVITNQKEYDNLQKILSNAIGYHQNLVRQNQELINKKASEYSFPVFTQQPSLSSQYEKNMPTGGSFSMTGLKASMLASPQYQKFMELNKFKTTPAWQANPTPTNPMYQQLMAGIKGMRPAR